MKKAPFFTEFAWGCPKDNSGERSRGDCGELRVNTRWEYE
jgi:hypothetical protein